MSVTICDSGGTGCRVRLQFNLPTRARDSRRVVRLCVFLVFLFRGARRLYVLFMIALVTIVIGCGVSFVARPMWDLPLSFTEATGVR